MMVDMPNGTIKAIEDSNVIESIFETQSLHTLILDAIKYNLSAEQLGKSFQYIIDCAVEKELGDE